MTTPPPRPRAWQTFLSAPGLGSRWPVAVRSALTLAVPALGMWLAGHGAYALLVALGTFAMLYGENRPFRVRWRVVATIGAILIASVAAGGYLSELLQSRITDANLRAAVLVVVMSLLAGTAVFIGTAVRAGPPGPMFVVLTAGVGWVVVSHGIDPAIVVGCTALGVASSLVVSMAPALWSRDKPQTAAIDAAITAVGRFLDADSASTAELAAQASRNVAGEQLHNAWTVLHDAAQTDGELADRLWAAHQRLAGAPDGTSTEVTESGYPPPLPRPSIVHRLSESAHAHTLPAYSAGRLVIASLLAGALSIILALGRPDWAIIAVVLVLQMGPDRVRGSLRGVQRMIGTSLGLALFVVIHSTEPNQLTLILLLAALNFLIELTVASNYGLAAVFITPLALLMSSPSGANAVWSTAGSRLAETTIGVTLAIASLWVLWRHGHRATLRLAQRRTLGRARALLDVAVTQTPLRPPASTMRRDLQWTLLGADTAGSNAALDEPAWAKVEWPHHLSVCSSAYDVLAACWRAPTGEPVDATTADRLRARMRGLNDDDAGPSAN
ncbi:FUSC family protein [Gordonia sp. TBRC 11910]|uniref:FUSC family protein n=1 Tax=Gordonia asplenii TaxID=2725283 RepID=A0A848L2V6_9ACTN|nr:FUSC family protein [Gordonia asplenii]NMO05096.1 FUSC family protein [Gordonia asplenii]